MKVVPLHISLEDTIKRAIGQDRTAQKMLYDKFAPGLLSISRQYVPSIEEAEDILITAFMKILKNLEKLDNYNHVHAWMKRITVNESISYLRTKKNMRIEGIEDYEWADTDHNMEGQMAVRDIQSMIDKLPEGCKVVFNLYAVEGYKHLEIAQLLYISEGTSKSQLAYARKLLQEMILEQQKIGIHG